MSFQLQIATPVFGHGLVTVDAENRGAIQDADGPNKPQTQNIQVDFKMLFVDVPSR